MSHHHDLDATTRTAWTGLRRRLADRLDRLTEGDELRVAHPEPRGIAGEEPLVLVVTSGPDGLLDLCDEDAGVQLVAGRRADEIAVRLVELLRDVHAVPHPCFLEAEGLEVDPSVPVPGIGAPAAAHDPADDLAREGHPLHRSHLLAMTHHALDDLLVDPHRHDDGTTSLASGESVLFVRVHPTRPSIVLEADIVVDPDAPDASARLDRELRILDGLHPLWKFRHEGGRVVMSHEMAARPFFAATLQMLVRRFVMEVDQIAAGLVVRVGGRRFLEEEPQEDERDVVMAGLIELLHLDRVRATTVAGLFDHDRLEIIRQLVRIRRGEVSCGEHDQAIVLEALRKALRVVADGEPSAVAVPHPAPTGTVQEPLLDDLTGLGAEETLDLGWSA